MAEFTDTVNEVDNTGFTDEEGATDVAPEPPQTDDTTTDAGVSPPVLSNNSAEDTNTETTESTDTPTPKVTPTPTDSTQESAGEEVTETQDIYALLLQLQTEQQEYETQVLETAETLTEQAKNTLSCLVLTIVLIGFLSGLVLARSVWRKL